MIQKESWRYFL